jgi:hypothetical protein
MQSSIATCQGPGQGLLDQGVSQDRFQTQTGEVPCLFIGSDDSSHFVSRFQQMR